MFGPSTTVFHYNDEEGLIELLAEEPESPGVTHDGRLILRGNFSTSKQEVVEYAQASLNRYEQALVLHKAELEQKLQYTQERLAMVQSNLAKLQAQP